MCQFKSGIAIKVSDTEVEVKTLPLNDSHTDIRKKYNISECNNGLSRFSTPVELVPSKLDFNDVACWKFDLGEPDWWTEEMTESAKTQLLKAAKEAFDAMKRGEKYQGDLYLDSVTSLPEVFGPKVGGCLFLRSATSIPKGFNPKVGVNLYLSSVTSLPEGFNPKVGRDLYLYNVESIPEGFNPKVGRDLYLNSVTSIPKGFPKVGRYLYLYSVKEIPKCVLKKYKGKIGNQGG